MSDDGSPHWERQINQPHITDIPDWMVVEVLLADQYFKRARQFAIEGNHVLADYCRDRAEDIYERLEKQC